MKLYKILIILLLTIFLTACQNTEFKYDLVTLKSEVKSAEIVNVYFDENDELVIEVIKSIEPIYLDDLLEDFSELSFTMLLGNPQITSGDSLKINYEEGYEIVSRNTILKYQYVEDSIFQDDIFSSKEFEEFILKWKNI